jgi:hypothetical protein
MTGGDKNQTKMKKWIVTGFFAWAAIAASANSTQKETTSNGEILVSEGTFVGSTATPLEDLPWFRFWFKRKVIRGGGGLECPPGQGICSVETDAGGSGGAGMATGGNGAPMDPGEYVAVDREGNFCYYVVDATKDRTLTGSQFVQSGSFTIYAKLAAELKIQPYTIPAGMYPIEHDGRDAMVVFKRPAK